MARLLTMIASTFVTAQDKRIAGGAARAVAAWLLVCCALVFAIVVVGGVTRLTHSGLSIVEWQPIVGTMPPLNQAEWQETFLKYQQTPEFQKVNHAMSLDDFKGIFWWEYFHRLLGRVIGMVVLLPLLWFALWRRIDRPLALKLAGILILGGLQGAMGWYMVKSGLVDNPRVSQYRLTAHLGLAFLIFAAMLWVALDLLFRRTDAGSAWAPAGLRQAATWLLGLNFLMVLSGGLVAGIHAGFAYNTFPLMNGTVAPAEIFTIEPWYMNFFNNVATVQFDHRMLAWLLAVVVPAFWIAAQRVGLAPRARLGANLMLIMLIIQIALGIATLLLVVPVPLAAAHQAGAVLLFGTALFTRHALR